VQATLYCVQSLLEEKISQTTVDKKDLFVFGSAYRNPFAAYTLASSQFRSDYQISDRNQSTSNNNGISFERYSDSPTSIQSCSSTNAGWISRTED
jgi:hypothetical protein